MIRFYFTLLSLFISIISIAQQGMGEWRMIVSTAKAIDVAASETTVYTAFENGLQILDLNNNQEESEFLNAINGLSDIEISALYFDQQDDALLIGYANGNIDKLKNGRIYNIPALKLANVPSSKRINRFERKGNFVYVATDYAILELNLSKTEVRNSFFPTAGNQKITDISFVGDTIFALTPTQLLRGQLNNPALPDPSQWTIDTRVPSVNNRFYHEMAYFNNELHVLRKTEIYGGDTVFRVTNSGLVPYFVFPFNVEINSLSELDNELALNTAEGTFLFNTNGEILQSFISFNFNIEVNANRLVKNSRGYWMADARNGLYFIVNQFAIKNFPLDGPRNNAFYSIDWQEGQLAIASGRLLLKLPSFSRNGVHLMNDEGDWDLKNVDNVPQWVDKDIWDFLDVSINPKNTKQYAVCTYSTEPLTIFTNGEAQIFNPTNSTLRFTFAGNGWSNVSDVCFDERENLWALNGYTEKPLNVRDKNGNWFQFDNGQAARNTQTGKMIVDFRNNVWFATAEQGLFGYNYNRTLDNSLDDKKIQLTTGSSAGDLPSKNVTAIAADFDDEIWIGTDAGFAILYNASRSFDATPGNYNAQRIKVQFEGNVEYVLGNTHITDIEVDGGNRKWMATANAGIILLSADGSEIIEQHNTQNSPLISDNIFDLKLDHQTGVLYILTDKGLVTYRTNATYEDPTYSSVNIFPNPVRPNYFGPITIQGIRYDSDVKITDVAGNLVYKTTSNGGTATWHGQTLTGEKAATGVYIIWTATNQGKDEKVGKVAVIR